MLTSIGGLWNRISAAFDRSDIGIATTAHGDTRHDEDLVRPTATRYAAIREAVERRVNAFLRQELLSHLEIGFNELFLLHYIEIAADSQGTAVLDQFLHEFSPESRVHWVKKLLGPTVGRHVSLEQFAGLDREFTAADLADTDPFEEELNQAAAPPYRVVLHGRWESGPAPQQLASSSGVDPLAPLQAARMPGPGLRLSIQDAKSPDPRRGGEARAVQIEHFPAVLGSSVHADVEVAGYYVSARHCTLHCEEERIWLVDHSTNGTWVDGERVRAGGRVALANGALLGFGREGGRREHDRYPTVDVQLMRKSLATEVISTPVAPPRATPVAPGFTAPVSTRPPEEKASLAVLSIVDATGNPRRDVLKLPYTIGRGSAQDYVVPEGNHGVSREHLVIEEINRSGAVTINRAVGRNGTFAGNQALPERFLWRFGEEIALGERWTGAPVVRIRLRQGEQTP